EPALVLSLIDPAAFIQRAPEVLNRFFMIGVSRSNPAIVFNAKMSKSRSKLGDYLIDVLLERDPARVGRALDVNAMLVGSGEEEGINTALAFEPGQGISHQGGVDVAQVRPGVGVVDGSRYVKVIFHSVCPETRETRK